MSDTALLQAPLHHLHTQLGPRMVAFADYSMSVQYPLGLMAEHKHTRNDAGLFDVSQMGQLRLHGKNAATTLETLVSMDVVGLGVGKQRYGLLLNEQGGIMDDLMFVNQGDDIFIVVNGACKAQDMAHIQSHIGHLCGVIPMPERALLALQGPQSANALSEFIPNVSRLVFMTGAHFQWRSCDLFITRSGYTGEDGFEISIDEQHASDFVQALIELQQVKAIGLGARNSLRLETSLCLYGNDIDTLTTPVEAQLQWALQKVRRSGGELEGGYLGAQKVLAQLDAASALQGQRVGLVSQELIPVREHVELQELHGNRIGEITSGLLEPTVDTPIAMGYVTPSQSQLGNTVYAMVRGKAVNMVVSTMPF